MIVDEGDLQPPLAGTHTHLALSLPVHGPAEGFSRNDERATDGNHAGHPLQPFEQRDRHLARFARMRCAEVEQAVGPEPQLQLRQVRRLAEHDDRGQQQTDRQRDLDGAQDTAQVRGRAAHPGVGVECGPSAGAAKVQRGHHAAKQAQHEAEAQACDSDLACSSQA